jgi:sterol desaturase/sphingolipid hydroxylase (fatty acid hydroxylase superfamily)
VAYLKLAVQFVLIPLVTLPILIGQIAKPTGPRWSVTVLLVCQVWTVSLIVWSGMWNVAASDPPVAHTFRWLTVWVLLAGMTIVVGFSVYWLHKLLQRPHPFVEISP